MPTRGDDEAHVGRDRLRCTQCKCLAHGKKVIHQYCPKCETEQDPDPEEKVLSK